jgi:hypothetical protein
VEEIPDVSQFTETSPGHELDEGVLKGVFPGANPVEDSDTTAPTTSSRKK